MKNKILLLNALMNFMNNIAIIPARGGSKRIHKKNIRNFIDQPIIAYSIKAALRSGLFSEVMVSTDDQEIAKTSLQFGAKVPFLRTSGNSGDHSTTMDVLVEVVEKYTTMGLNFDNVCCIYPCAPFVTSNKLQMSFNKFIECKSDSLVPIVKYSTPIQRSIILKENLIQFNFIENLKSRSQDLDKFYYDSGQFYWIRTDIISKKEQIFTDNTYGWEISELEAQDIDNETDWLLAEFKYKLLLNI